MEKFLRDWRQDALNKAQYESAIFIGDKLLALTNDDNDAFWLAQVHFATGNYTRAQSFLSKQDLISRNPACRYLAGHCLIKQSRFDEALAVLGERNPTHLISNGPSNKRKASNQPRSGRRRDDDAVDEEAATRRFEAAMCFLRGICYAKQNAFDRAKECYKDAVRIDVQCFEAFQQLMKNSLLSPDEEWQFLDSLDFDSIHLPGDPKSSQEAAEFTKMLYTTRLSKYRNPTAFDTAYDSLSTHYQLAANPDLQLARADLLYTQCRYRDALTITNAILEEDKYNFAIYPVHLACLYELKMKNLLFLISHDLADSHPEEPSYSTAARLFMGTHLPQIFLGMQNHALNNMTIAEEFLKTAYGLCKTDPLLLNEMGIVKYHQDRPKEAVQYFTAALKVADENDSEPSAWLAARTNLGHAFRRLRHYNRALAEFDEVLRAGGKDAAIFSAKGLILMEQNRPQEAVVVLHEALAIHPQDSIATELLNKALEETALMDGAAEEEAEDLADFEQLLERKKVEASQKVNYSGDAQNRKMNMANLLLNLDLLLSQNGSSEQSQLNSNRIARGNTPSGAMDHVLQPDAPPSVIDAKLWIVDRILEPQSIPHFIEATMFGVLSDGSKSSFPPLSEEVVMLMQQPLASWAPPPFDASQEIPVQQMMDAVNAKNRLEIKPEVQIAARWHEYIKAHYNAVSSRSHRWVVDSIDRLRVPILEELANVPTTADITPSPQEWLLTNKLHDLLENGAQADSGIFLPMDGYEGEGLAAQDDAPPRPDAAEPYRREPISFSANANARKGDYYLRLKYLSRTEVWLGQERGGMDMPAGLPTGFDVLSDMAKTAQCQVIAQEKARLELRGEPVPMEQEQWVMKAHQYIGTGNNFEWGYVAYRLSHDHTDEEWEAFKAKFEADIANWGRELSGVDTIREKSKIHWRDARDLGIADGDMDALRTQFQTFRDSEGFPLGVHTDILLAADKGVIDSYLHPVPQQDGFVIAIDADHDPNEVDTERLAESPGYKGVVRVLGSLLWDDLGALVFMQTQGLAELWPLAMHHPQGVYEGPLGGFQ
ncbi:hypothetical protein TrVFT333_000237 [Trichoderma virens FT-333]|nr:hypothetical protein TrVFT333_000237 [Trichoderma virens FT-333]